MARKPGHLPCINHEEAFKILKIYTRKRTLQIYNILEGAQLNDQT